MPDEQTTGESGTATGASTSPAAGGDQTSGQVENTPDAEHVDAPENDVDDDAIAAEQIAKQTDSNDEGATDSETPSPADEKAEGEESVPKSLKEARGHISNLETQIKPLRQLETKVLEIGGLPVLEMAQPVLDALINPEISGGDLIKVIGQVAPHLDAQQIAWDVVDSNREAVVEHFCGDGITPEILEKLVEGYENGDFKLEGEDADDAFLSDRERRERERSRENSRREAETARREKETQAQQLNNTRQTSITNVAKICQDTVAEVLKPFAVAEGDSDDVKAMKEFITEGVDSVVMRTLSVNPIWQRVQKLLQGNGFAAAENLTKGALTHVIRELAAAQVKKAQSLVTGTIGKAQAHAKKVKEVRVDPSGASTQADALPKREAITTKDPNWRQKLDDQLKHDLAALDKKQHARGPGGKFI